MPSVSALVVRREEVVESENAIRNTTSFLEGSVIDDRVHVRARKNVKNEST
jgi:hypothetical protein